MQLDTECPFFCTVAREGFEGECERAKEPRPPGRRCALVLNGSELLREA